MLKHPCEDCEKNPEGEGKDCSSACVALLVYTQCMSDRKEAAAAINAYVEEFCGVRR
jgi:hypothetical protein